MLVTTATIQALQTTVDMRFQEAYQSTELWIDSVASTMTSSVDIDTYAWATQIPQMREWLGPRIINNLTNEEYQLKNRDWEDTVGLDRNQIMDDKIGLFTDHVIPELGRQGARHPQTQIALQMENTTDLSFDGLPFFDASHPLDPAGVQSNLNTSRPLTLANYELSYQAFTATTGADGLPLQTRSTILVVPPQLEIVARRIINADIVADPGGIAAGVTNVMTGSAKIVVARELASPTTWYLIDDTKTIKPFIWQNRMSTQLTSLTQLTDANVFSSRTFLWGIDSRGASGYSLWFLAQKNTA